MGTADDYHKPPKHVSNLRLNRFASRRTPRQLSTFHSPVAANKSGQGLFGATIDTNDSTNVMTSVSPNTVMRIVAYGQPMQNSLECGSSIRFLMSHQYIQSFREANTSWKSSIRTPPRYRGQYVNKDEVFTCERECDEDDGGRDNRNSICSDFSSIRAISIQYKHSERR